MGAGGGSSAIRPSQERWKPIREVTDLTARIALTATIAALAAIGAKPTTAHSLTAQCRDAKAPVLCSIHQQHRTANRLRQPAARPPIHYGWIAERSGHARRLRILAYWRSVKLRAERELAGLHHPSQTACRSFVARRFARLDQATALAVVERESHCYWAAQNPSSTAAGVFQFLDHWGPLSSRLDAVWSVNRAYRAVRDGGWSPWYPLP